MVKNMCVKFHAKIILFPGPMEEGATGSPKQSILNMVKTIRLINTNLIQLEVRKTTWSTFR